MSFPTAIEHAAPLARALQQPYRHGFVTEVETDALPPGLDEDTVRAISRRKREPAFLLNWRLAALRATNTFFGRCCVSQLDVLRKLKTNIR